MCINKKIIFSLFLLIVLIIALAIPNCSVAAMSSLDDIQSSMSGVGDRTDELDSSSGIGGAINTVVGLIQIAGTGISIVMITIQGIKYIMASPSEKGSVKHSAIPIVIGSILLFGAVNVVGIIFDIAENLPNE